MTSHFHHPVSIQTFPVRVEPAREPLTLLQFEDAKGNSLMIYMTSDEVCDLRDVLNCWTRPVSIAA